MKETPIPTSVNKFFLFKRSNGFYYIGWNEGNRRVWRSTKCVRKPDALAYLQQFDQQQAALNTTKQLRLSEFMEDFSSLFATSIRQSTLRSYKLAVNQFITAVGDKLLSEYNSEDILHFQRYWQEKKLATTSVNAYYRGVKSVFAHAVRHDYLQASPFQKVREIKIAQSVPKYLSQTELQSLLAQVKSETMRDLFLVCALSGLRRSEALNLKAENIDLQNRVISVVNTEEFSTKSGKFRNVPMHEALVTVFERRMNGNGYLFCKTGGFKLNADYVSHVFQTAVKDANLDSAYHLHTLRHTAASYLVTAGVSLYTVQSILGHSSPAVTQKYSHLAPNTLNESINRIQF